jgi:NAD+ kinase
MGEGFDRIGLVVHPSRSLTRTVGTLEQWAAAAGVEVVRLSGSGSADGTSPMTVAAGCDLVIALGGDGTTLAALHAAAPAGTPVMGIACGSLGALTAVGADRLTDALDRVAAGDAGRRELPALRITGPVSEPLQAFNDVVLVRRGAGQVIVHVDAHGERVVRFAGDGVVIATPLGSSGYTLAVGGPILHPEAQQIVTTPLAPHGGSCPPVVTAADGDLRITLEPGYGGARVEVDGQPRGTVEPPAPEVFEVSHVPAAAQLIVLEGAESFWAGLRRRRIIIDSPRILARDEREAAAADTAPAP